MALLESGFRACSIGLRAHQLILGICAHFRKLRRYGAEALFRIQRAGQVIENAILLPLHSHSRDVLAALKDWRTRRFRLKITHMDYFA
ncbi:MAG: hypothetical protein ACI9UN_003747 [Granulosicoccus sp.]|jgi:hypothetical protein